MSSTPALWSSESGSTVSSTRQGYGGRPRTAGAPIFASLTAVWESSPAIAREYGAISADLRAAGQLIPTNDIWIAATARVYGATVVTNDPHFGRISGLSVVDWTQP